MINFVFDDQKVSIPEEWSEVTVQMFINPDFLSGDSLRLLSSLSGVTVEKLANTTEDLTPYFKKCSEFIAANPKGWIGEFSETLTLRGKACKVPKNINFETFGQKILLGGAMKKGGVQAIPDAIAIYLAPQVLGAEWFNNWEDLKEDILKMPIASVNSIADFFLSLLQNSSKNGQTV